MPAIEKQVNSHGAWTIFIGSSLIISDLSALEARKIMEAYERALKGRAGTEASHK